MDVIEVPREQIERLLLAVSIAPAEFANQEAAEEFYDEVMGGISEAAFHWLGNPERMTPLEELDGTAEYILVGNSAAAQEGL